MLRRVEVGTAFSVPTSWNPEVFDSTSGEEFRRGDRAQAKRQHFGTNAGISAVSTEGRERTFFVYIGCGAISNDATWVAVHRPGEKYDRCEDIVFTTLQRNQVKIAWIDDSHLSVSCRCSSSPALKRVTVFLAGSSSRQQRFTEECLDVTWPSGNCPARIAYGFPAKP